jgi:hypothetical protein
MAPVGNVHVNVFAPVLVLIRLMFSPAHKLSGTSKEETTAGDWYSVVLSRNAPFNLSSAKIIPLGK